MSNTVVVEESKKETEIKIGDLVHYNGKPAIITEGVILVKGHRVWVISVVSLETGQTLDYGTFIEYRKLENVGYHIRNFFDETLITPINGKVILEEN